MASKTLPSLRLSDFCKFTERDSQAEWEFYGEHRWNLRRENKSHIVWARHGGWPHGKEESFRFWKQSPKYQRQHRQALAGIWKKEKEERKERKWRFSESGHRNLGRPNRTSWCLIGTVLVAGEILGRKSALSIKEIIVPPISLSWLNINQSSWLCPTRWTLKGGDFHSFDWKTTFI